MLLTITCTAAPATDLGFLLHKNPDKVHSFGVSSGQAHVFYPEASAARCTAALLLEVDPVALVRGRRSGGPADRPLSPSRSTSMTARTPPPRCWPSPSRGCSAPR